MSLEAVFYKFPVIDMPGDYYLRQFRPSDASAYFDFYSRPEIAQFLPDSMVPPDSRYSEDEIRGMTDQFNRRVCVYWGIARKSDDLLVGGCGFHNWDRFHARIEIAYDLHPEFWRRGIMKLAIRAVCAFAFLNMGVQRVQATTVQENDASNSLLLKMGFKYECMLRRYKFFKGKMIDVMMFSYISDDFWRDVKRGLYDARFMEIRQIEGSKSGQGV